MTDYSTINNNMHINTYDHPQIRQTPTEQTISAPQFGIGKTNYVNFTGDQYVPQHKKSKVSKVIGFSILSIAALIGTAMHVGGGIKNAFQNKEIVSTTKNGFKKILHIKAKPTRPIQIEHDVVTPQKQKSFTVTKDGGRKTCTIPNKINHPSGVRAQGTIVQQAQKIGAITYRNGIPEGAKIKSYTFTYKNCLGLNKYKVTVRNGKVASITNSKNKSVTLSENALKKIQENIEKIKKGETAGIKDYVVQSYKTTENGITAQYKLQGSNYKISSFITDKFAVDSDEAIAYCVKNPEAKALLNAVKTGVKDINRISGEINNRLGTFKIENGEIIGLTEGGIYYSCKDPHFIALKEKNQKLFEDILNNKYRYKSETFGIK